jgi:hypothetical protein
MGPLTRLYLGLGAVEPDPADVRRAEGLVDALTGQSIFDPDALDDLERQLRGAVPTPAEFGADEARVVAAVAVRHLAVLADPESVWLAPFAQVPFCHLPAGARLAELSHEYRRSPARGVRLKTLAHGLLRALVQSSGNPGSRAYLESLCLDDAAFFLPDILLALAHSPHRYAPELLAAVEPTLTGALFELPAWIFACVKRVADDTAGIESPVPSWWTQSGELSADVAGDVGSALREFSEFGLAPAGPERFAAFSGLLRDALRLYLAELERSCLNALRAPELAMNNLVERKSPSARHAHGQASLNGTLLDSYFDGSVAERRKLTAALSTSNWVKAGSPDNSPFLTVLTTRSGPMGKIFSAEDVSIIRRWITWLAAPESVAPLGAVPLAVPDFDQQPDRPDEPVPSEFIGPQVRELFYDLVAGHDRSRTLRLSAAFVEYWLDAAQHIEGPAFTWELPERYDAAEFPDWMRRTYHAMASAPVAPVSDSGKAHRDRSFHGAADNLVDGAWLQGLSRRVGLRESAQLLYDIYWDEIGNGRPGHSHGNLYEDLLVGLGYDLPKFWTREFIDDIDFLDEGFMAPVFRLAIAEFPETRFPEIVGVNMVCEFHGLGSAGIAKADGLTDLGFDTSFTRLHIADDNIEMGHSAKSRDAVVFLMAEATRLGVTDQVWERVRRGATAMRMAYVVLMQGRLGIAPTQVPTQIVSANDR